VTVVPLTIKRRQNRKVLIPPPPMPDAAVGGFDADDQDAGQGFHWKRLLDEGATRRWSDLARAMKLEPGWVSEVLRMTMLAPDIVERLSKAASPGI
jgi:hypothetical protein